MGISSSHNDRGFLENGNYGLLLSKIDLLALLGKLNSNVGIVSEDMYLKSEILTPERIKKMNKEFNDLVTFFDKVEYFCVKNIFLSKMLEHRLEALMQECKSLKGDSVKEFFELLAMSQSNQAELIDSTLMDEVDYTSKMLDRLIENNLYLINILDNRINKINQDIQVIQKKLSASDTRMKALILEVVNNINFNKKYIIDLKDFLPSDLIKEKNSSNKIELDLDEMKESLINNLLNLKDKSSIGTEDYKNFIENRIICQLREVHDIDPIKLSPLIKAFLSRGEVQDVIDQAVMHVESIIENEPTYNKLKEEQSERQSLNFQLLEKEKHKEQCVKNRDDLLVKNEKYDEYQNLILDTKGIDLSNLLKDLKMDLQSNVMSSLNNPALLSNNRENIIPGVDFQIENKSKNLNPDANKDVEEEKVKPTM